VALAERDVAFYGIAILVSGLLLMLIGVQQIEVYYVVYLIEFFVVMENVASFGQSLKRNLRPVILVFLLGFAYIVVQRMLQILS
jgi:hypothetical protein